VSVQLDTSTPQETLDDIRRDERALPRSINRLKHQPLEASTA
jgi:hypothetical protein